MENDYIIEELIWNGRNSEDRGTWYGKKCMNQYPRDLAFIATGCYPFSWFKNNGTRHEEGGRTGYVVKQSGVPGGKIILVAPQSCRGKEAYLKYKK